MNISPRPLLLSLAGAVSLLGCATMQAGVLTAVGTDANDPSWRTTTVAKPLDGDANNVYGSLGYFLPRFATTVGGTFAFSTANGTNGTLNTLPAYLTVAAVAGTGLTGADSMFGQKAVIDDPANVAGADVNTGIAFHNNSTNPAGANAFITLTIGTGVPTTPLRIGILSDTSGGGNNPTNFTLAQTAGTGTGSASLASLAPAAAQADWYFFDIANAVAGDVYTLSIGSVAAGSKPTISGITVDAVPEPSTYALLAVTGLAMVVLRRRPRLA